MDKHYHILLTDDDHFLRDMTSRFLQTYYTVTTKSNGLEAMAWLDQGNQPDLIVTDLHMPHMDGLELIKAIRSSSAHYSIPIIVLTAAEESQTRIECLEQGADNCVSKPFSPLELVAKIKVLLRRVDRQEGGFPVPDFIPMSLANGGA